MLASLLLALGIALVGGFLTSLVLSARPVASRALADYYAPTRQTRRERIGLAIARRLPFSLEAWENHLRWAQRNGAYRGDSLGSIFFQCLLFGGLACLVVLVNPAPAAFLLPVGAFAYPLIRLRAKANTARKRVARTLPETAALIAAELAAGVAPETAIARAASLPGPLSALLEEAMQASRESGRPLFSRKPISGTLIEYMRASGLPALYAFGSQVDLVAAKGVAGASLMSEIARALAAEHRARLTADVEKLDGKLVMAVAIFFFVPFVAILLYAAINPVLTVFLE